MGNKIATVSVIGFLLQIISSSANASTVYTNAVQSVIFDRSNSTFFDSSGVKTLYSDYTVTSDGSPATNAGFISDGFVSAQATSANNGTETVSASGQRFNYVGIAETFLRTSFDFSPSTKGRITIKLAGWAIANGSGFASVQALISENQSGIGQQYAYSTASAVYTTPAKPGFQKLSLVKSLFWKGGDTIEISNRAFVQVYGDYVPTLPGLTVPTGPGFASAYIDPTISISSVPEPASWGMLVAGFGVIGAASRRRASALA